MQRTQRWSLLVVVMVAVLAVAGFWYIRTAEALPKEEQFEAQVALGDGYIFSLDANPSTGYAWAVAADATKVELVGREFITGAAPGLMGAGGSESFELRGLARGVFQVKLTYESPGVHRPERIVVYQLTVY